MKLPAHSAGLPGNDLLFNIVPLDPAHRAGLAGHAPVNDSTTVQLANLPNHSFSYFLIRSAFSNPHSAFEYANFLIDELIFLQALHERLLG